MDLQGLVLYIQLRIILRLKNLTQCFFYAALLINIPFWCEKVSICSTMDHTPCILLRKTP